MKMWCPECGCRVYVLGCVNCNEADYIAQQAVEDADDQCEGCGLWTERLRYTADDVGLCAACYAAVPTAGDAQE